MDITSWPSPARESLFVELPYDLPEGKIQLINSSGMVVLSKPHVYSSNQYTLDISNIDQGQYNLLVETPGQVFLRWIVVIK